MSLESTCIGEKCKFWEVKNGEPDCPFFLNTMWEEEGKNTTTVLNDCAPKRNTILLMDYSSRAIGIQKDYGRQREMHAAVIRSIGKVVEEMQKRNKMLQDKLEIPYEEETVEVLDDPTVT